MRPVVHERELHPVAPEVSVCYLLGAGFSAASRNAGLAGVHGGVQGYGPDRQPRFRLRRRRRCLVRPLSRDGCVSEREDQRRRSRGQGLDERHHHAGRGNPTKSCCGGARDTGDCGQQDIGDASPRTRLAGGVCCGILNKAGLAPWRSGALYSQWGKTKEEFRFALLCSAGTGRDTARRRQSPDVTTMKAHNIPYGLPLFR